ncbi:MAG: RNA-binding domain-containing protein [Methylomicrobium sp.]
MSIPSPIVYFKKYDNYPDIGGFIDFKSEMYFTNPKKDKIKSRSEFIKDIVSMWNTPRDTDAYIIIGIKNTNNENKQIGIDKNNIPDDANLRAQFEGLSTYAKLTWYLLPKFSKISFNAERRVSKHW